jgi:hypothetical protein
MYRSGVLIGAIERWIEDKCIPTETISNGEIRKMGKLLNERFDDGSVLEAISGDVLIKYNN